MKALAGRARTEYRQTDRDGQHSGRSGTDHNEAARNRQVARTRLRVDARSQGRRRLDRGCGASRHRDRALLLGEALGELW